MYMLSADINADNKRHALTLTTFFSLHQMAVRTTSIAGWVDVNRVGRARLRRRCRRHQTHQKAGTPASSEGEGGDGTQLSQAQQGCLAAVSRSSL